MPIDGRINEVTAAKGSLDSGPMMAKIVGHLDPNFQGGLEVTLIRESGNTVGDETQTYNVKYASPFYGVTAYEFSGKNNDYNDSQKSYGFWGVPPDIGVTGIVVFINGDPTQGYWIACIPDKFANHMVPAIGATKNYVQGEDYEQGEHPLPVSEHNRKANEMNKALEVDKIERAVHPIANRFKTQGLIRDEFRGPSTSTSRRDVPNMVFGMSSPGPIDRKGKRSFIGTQQSPSNTPVPVSRLGGTQLVFDDGDDRYYRKTDASSGPPEYTPLGGATPPTDIPYNEHFRIRTRTGHQILFHNSEDFIYIGNSKGTAWIELSSNGKVEIFANDSISFRTKKDFNFYADKDINFEAGGLVNIKSGADFNLESVASLNIVVGADQKISVSGGSHLTASTHTETAPGGINMNGPAASPASPIATVSLPDLPAPGAAQSASSLSTIVKRAPTPEPYPQHEHLDPSTFADTSSSPAALWKKYVKPSDSPF